MPNVVQARPSQQLVPFGRVTVSQLPALHVELWQASSNSAQSAFSVHALGEPKPRTATTWLDPPKVENRKSPVSGSTTAPSAPDRPVRKSRREVRMGSPSPSIW